MHGSHNRHNLGIIQTHWYKQTNQTYVPYRKPAGHSSGRVVFGPSPRPDLCLVIRRRPVIRRGSSFNVAEKGKLGTPGSSKGCPGWTYRLPDRAPLGGSWYSVFFTSLQRPHGCVDCPGPRFRATTKSKDRREGATAIHVTMSVAGKVKLK